MQADFDTFTHTYSCTRRTYKGLKGIVVNQLYPSLQEGSYEITLTVPLKNNDGSRLCHSFKIFFI